MTCQSSNQCTSPGTTSNDGFLDTFLGFASFNQSANSYLSFVNPFNGYNPLSQGSVLFWAKFPVLSGDGKSYQGTLFDCGDSFSARTFGGTVRTNITMNSFLSNGVSVLPSRSSLDATVSPVYLLESWNHYTFSFNAE